jgi:hypothetical protein
MEVNETNQPPEALALAALGWTLQDTARADRLLALTGLTPEDLRSQLGEPALLAAILRSSRRTSRTSRLRRRLASRSGAPGRGPAGAGAMTRPLLITDCDEVLLHMLRHFADWVDEAHGLSFALDAPGFREAVRHKDTGVPVAEDRIWPLLDGFFDSEMHRQNVVPGAVEALQQIGQHAEIVILTNIGDDIRRGGSSSLLRSTSATGSCATAAARALPSSSCSRNCSRASPCSSTTWRSTTTPWPSTRRRCGGCT